MTKKLKSKIIATLSSFIILLGFLFYQSALIMIGIFILILGFIWIYD